MNIFNFMAALRFLINSATQKLPIDLIPTNASQGSLNILHCAELPTVLTYQILHFDVYFHTEFFEMPSKQLFWDSHRK